MNWLNLSMSVWNIQKDHLSLSFNIGIKALWHTKLLYVKYETIKRINIC